MVVGIICEYNPLHLGHKKQLDRIRETFGPDTAIVCAMSGNFVQRGSPAILDKSARAKAAILCGADLVVELPVTTALSSAEGFAAGGVNILSQLCDVLCFGAENAEKEALMDTAKALLSCRFPPLLKQQLEKGLSFPAARQAALENLGKNGGLLEQPNNILAVEYCKAILTQESQLDIFPIHRQGSYHAEAADSDNPSATAVRALMQNAYNWRTFVPREAFDIFEQAPMYSLEAGERVVLSQLRRMKEGEFEALPFGSEGLWRKFMYACRQEESLEAILTATKSKRYTRSRLQRMAMCAYLGITQSDMEAGVPYVRVLAFTSRGRSLLRDVKKTGFFVNIGQKQEHPHWLLEQRCGDLYGLFRKDSPDKPGQEEKRRIFYRE